MVQLSEIKLFASVLTHLVLQSLKLLRKVVAQTVRSLSLFQEIQVVELLTSLDRPQNFAFVRYWQNLQHLVVQAPQRQLQQLV